MIGKESRRKGVHSETQRSLPSSLHLGKRKSSFHTTEGRHGANVCFSHLSVGGEATLKEGWTQGGNKEGGYSLEHFTRVR